MGPAPGYQPPCPALPLAVMVAAGPLQHRHSPQPSSSDEFVPPVTQRDKGKGKMVEEEDQEEEEEEEEEEEDERWKQMMMRRWGKGGGRRTRTGNI